MSTIIGPDIFDRSAPAALEGFCVIASHIWPEIFADIDQAKAVALRLKRKGVPLAMVDRLEVNLESSDGLIVPYSPTLDRSGACQKPRRKKLIGELVGYASFENRSGQWALTDGRIHAKPEGLSGTVLKLRFDVLKTDVGLIVESE